MDPVGERVLWFVLGFLAGAIALRLFQQSRRRATPAVRHDAEPAMPQRPLSSAQAPPDLDYPHAPGPARLIDVGAARAAGFNMKHAEDLTILDGIGPKLEELLRANGVAGFAQLAQLDEPSLLEILDRGGASFRYANPSTWAQQAALVVQNDWAGLKQLQRELTGIG